MRLASLDNVVWRCVLEAESRHRSFTRISREAMGDKMSGKEHE